MKVYVHEKGVILVGKGWEVVQKLKEFNKEHATLAEWVQKTAPK